VYETRAQPTRSIDARIEPQVVAVWIENDWHSVMHG